MQAENARGDKGSELIGQEEPSPTTAADGAPAVEGVPWWGGVTHQQGAFHPTGSSPCAALYMEPPVAVVSAVRPVAFAYPHHVAQPTPNQLPEGFGNGASDESQLQGGAAAVFSSSATDYMLQHTQLEFGHSVAPAAYSYADPYYGGMMAAYGAQTMIHPHMLGIHQSRMLLPSEVMEEEPVYVNAKQYNGIMRRRQSRAKAESENKLVKSRKPYLHESRHLHAMRRARGCGGRFLNTKADDSKMKSDGTTTSEELSSQGDIVHRRKKARQTEKPKSCASQMVQGCSNGVSCASDIPSCGGEGEGDFVSSYEVNARMGSKGDSGPSGGILAKTVQQKAMAMQ